MKKKLLIIGTFVATIAIVVLHPVFDTQADAKPNLPVNNSVPGDQARIQLAILLDTSSSMSGLIDQTRNQLWQVVNEFAKSKKNGKTPALEVAVYEYGNSSLSAAGGYIRQVTALTGELDQVSEALFSLTTNGGDEFCGYVINNAVNELAWSNNDQDIKAIFIAGNEPFTQGPVPYQKAIAAAKQKGITVNTIHAGNHAEGAASGWQDGAVLAGGDYMSIDHNHKVAHIDAPQDKRIAELNASLNETYVPYGASGKEKMQRQSMQDEKSKSISAGLMAKRAASKASTMYDNSTWDLVDAIDKGAIELEKLEPAALPEEIRDLPRTEQNKYVKQKTEQRKKIQAEIMALSKERESYVKQQRAAAPGVSTVEAALTGAVRKQGEKKNYQFKSN